MLCVIYIKPKNEVFTWHLLTTQKQADGESFKHYLNLEH